MRGNAGPGAARIPGTMSQNRLYVGNLPYDSTEADITDAFSAHGTVQNVNLIMDRDTGRPRGFAFVEMPDDQAAQAAMSALDGAEVGGRTLKVNEARPREDRGSRGGGGGYGGGGGNRW